MKSKTETKKYPELNDKSKAILDTYQKVTKFITMVLIWTAMILFIPMFIWFPFWDAIRFWLGYIGAFTSIFILSIPIMALLMMYTQRKKN